MKIVKVPIPKESEERGRKGGGGELNHEKFADRTEQVSEGLPVCMVSCLIQSGAGDAGAVSDDNPFNAEATFL